MFWRSAGRVRHFRWRKRTLAPERFVIQDEYFDTLTEAEQLITEITVDNINSRLNRNVQRTGKIARTTTACFWRWIYIFNWQTRWFNKRSKSTLSKISSKRSRSQRDKKYNKYLRQLRTHLIESPCRWKLNHLDLLLKLSVQTEETINGLCKFADDTLQYVESLLTLGIDVTGEILVQNLEEKR